MGPHSVVVVYIDRAFAALALPAVTATLGAPARSHSGTLALAFALALTFTHGRLSSTGEPESLDGGGSRPPEVLLPEPTGLRPVAPSPADAAGGCPLAWGHPCLHCINLLHLGLFWGREGFERDWTSTLLLCHLTIALQGRGPSTLLIDFPQRRIPPLAPPSCPSWLPGILLPLLLLLGTQTHDPPPTESSAISFLGCTSLALGVHDMFGSLDIPPGTKICMDLGATVGVGSHCSHSCWVYVWAGAYICHHCYPAHDMPTIIFPAASHSMI